MAIAFLQFKQAYTNLVDASLSMPDLELDDNYPFYLLDFEQIEPAVRQWCSIHAARLMKNLPERADNPRCLSCDFLRAGLGKEGLCIGMPMVHCNVHPTILYSQEAVTPFLISVGVDVGALNEESIHLIYIQRTEEIYEQKRAKETGEGTK